MMKSKTGGHYLQDYLKVRGNDIVDGLNRGGQVAMIDTRHDNKLVFDISYCITTRFDANNQYYIITKDEQGKHY